MDTLRSFFLKKKLNKFEKNQKKIKILEKKQKINIQGWKN